MRRLSRAAIAVIALFATLALILSGCSSSAETGEAIKGCTTEPSASVAAADDDADFTPITIKHALGTTTLNSAPKRVATVAWANHEVPLALGVVPVGMAKANFGDDDGDGLLPWVKERLCELGGPAPVLFDENDGIDYEAVADTRPDVILAAYSGLEKVDYDRLSAIAPTIAYPTTAWGTPWREMIELNSKGMNKEAAGKELIATIEKQIAAAASKHPRIKNKSVMFLTHVDPTDLSQVSFYTTHDTRVMFFDDLGMRSPDSITKASTQTEQFSLTRSAEQVDALDDVDVIVTYGEGGVVDALSKDPLLSKMPAVERGAVVNLPSDGPLGTAANPTPLSISWILNDYLGELDKAAAKAE